MTDLSRLKLDALLCCHPEHCALAGCILYDQDCGKCRARQFMKMLCLQFELKFEKVPQVDPISAENIV